MTPKKLKHLILAVSLLGAQIPAATTLRAQDTNTIDIIRQLQKRVEELEQKVKSLESKPVNEPAGPDQRNKQRLEELDQQVKTLERQRQLDADAAEAKAKTTPQLTMTTEPFNGFGVSSPDKDFSLRLRGYVQADARFYIGDNIPINDTFLIRRMRPVIEGTIFRDFDYRIILDIASKASLNTANDSLLQDAVLNWHYWPALQIQAGKFKPPIGYEHLTSDANLLLLERGYPSQLVPNREVGIQLHGELFGGRLNYAAGVFNGVFDGGSEDFDTTDDHKDGIARLSTTPFKSSGQQFLEGLSLGVGGSIGNQKGTLPSFSTLAAQKFFSYASSVVASGTHWRVNPELQYTVGSFGVFGEYVVSSQELDRRAGTTVSHLTAANTAWNVTASYVLTGEPNTLKGVAPKDPFSLRTGCWGAWEFVARVGQLAVDGDVFPQYAAAGSAQRAFSFGAGLNWYLNRNIKINLDYEHTWFDGGSTTPGTVTAQDENAVLTRLQFAF